MRTVVINAKAITYAIYEGRTLIAELSSDRVLTASEVEELRTAHRSVLEAV
jgi:hypothetical protein